MRRKRLFYPFIKRFRRSFYKGAEVVNDYKSDFVRTILYKMCMQY